MIKAQVKAAEYRSRASEASALADACVLDHVREKYRTAAARWTDLAQLSDRQGKAGWLAVPKSLETADQGA